MVLGWQGRTQSKASTRGWWRSLAQTWQVSPSNCFCSSCPLVHLIIHQFYTSATYCVIWTYSMHRSRTIKLHFDSFFLIQFVCYCLEGGGGCGVCRCMISCILCFNLSECIRQKANAETSSPKTCSAMWRQHLADKTLNWANKITCIEC